MAYIYDIADTWNAIGTTFTAIKMNVTNTASASGAVYNKTGSALFELQTNGDTKLWVGRDGGLWLKTSEGGGAGRSIAGIGSAGAETWKVDGLGFANFNSVNASDFLAATRLLLSNDTIILRDAANTLAQRNSTNPQAFNLYNTYTDASNYERGFMRFVSNTLRIGTEKLGTGTARALEFYTDGALRMAISADGSNISIGVAAISSGGPSTAVGRLAIASGAYSFAAGHGISGNGGPEATGAYSTTISQGYGSRKSTASGIMASIFGGANALADKFGQDAYGFYGFAQIGDAQTSTLGFVGSTTDDTATEIFLFNVTNQRAVVPATKTWAFVLTAVARSSGGTDNAMYVRRGIIKRDGANNTVLVGAVDSVYTNETNAAWDIDVSADDTNESLKVTVTGAAATNIRWVAKVELTEVLFA